MATVTVETAQAQLANLIGGLQPGEAVVITQNDKPVARLVAESSGQTWPCKAGSYRKAEFWVAPDFDAPLEDFQEYTK